ncbi:MAG TPA: KamA family radical SAM protein [Candidatus Portnoybacteria bacterium]|jgi:lysine 2,3-aminomutase|nr:KamA family radical SAM protein [Candidatus Portnoybacteria bacterium]MDD5752328.1 KamA family radical SAM protein [Candidatus Portnoybacteria bacterium]HPJ80543.1 KamA family radical SAM protein [Candidatus Portnoybacteria bacterium]
MLTNKLTTYLAKLIKTCPEIEKQFIYSKQENREEKSTFSDPLMEEHHTVVRGLVHKYHNRALILLTLNCAAYCRFCTRRRKVSDIQKGVLSDKDLNNIVAYIKKHPDIKEIILSGGDPLTVPILLQKMLLKLSKLPQIKIIRIGTRLPVTDPKKINQKLIDVLKIIKNKTIYILIHFEHPKEITKSTIIATQKLKQVSTMLLSQSVFLKNINDSFDALYELFSKLIEIGIKPYYLYHCDPVKGAEHFIVNIRKEIKIVTKLRKNLSGLAFPIHIIDAPNGSGKIPVPLEFWGVKLNEYKDFNNKRLKT